MARTPKREIDRYIDKTVPPLPPPKKKRKFRWRWLTTYKPSTSDDRNFVCRTKEDANYHGAVCAFLNRHDSELDDDQIKRLEKHYRKKEYERVLDVWDEGNTDCDNPEPITVIKVKYYSKMESR